MSPTMMRQFWSLVEGVRANIPVTLDDRSLEQWLLRQLHSERVLNHGETAILSTYIHSRLPLIREFAQEF